MIVNNPSATALSVARRRAAHQIMDDPRIFDDPVALRILGLDTASVSSSDPSLLDDTSFARGVRASMAGRSRFAEDRLHAAVSRGVRRYVVLGAGLDTFACRNPYPQDALSVYEVDYPATQAWKRARLEETGIPVPGALTFVPVDFESMTLEEGMKAAGFDRERSAFFSWLGVTMYLTSDAMASTLSFVASLPPGSEIVFDYMVPPSLLDPFFRKILAGMDGRVTRNGEPFRSFFDPADLRRDLLTYGFHEIEDLSPEDMNSLYFQGRTDGLRFGPLAHIVRARS